MKHLLFLFLFISAGVFAQDKYLTKTGTLIFEASVPSFEEVKATNTAVTAILNTDNGEFAALALVKAFRFKNALMEEHFNENYAESDDYPKAIFKGKIDGFAVGKSSTIDGELSFHGKSKTYKDIKIQSKASGDNTIIVSGEFVANVSDFDIKIPKVVSNKLSEDVKIYFEFSLKKR
jgi:polyisoprenoid-binding protein YceI